MKKEYISPALELIVFETSDNIMDVEKSDVDPFDEDMIKINDLKEDFRSDRL